MDQEQWNKTKNARSTGCGGDDSLVYDAVPDEPYIGGVNLRLFAGGAPIRCSDAVFGRNNSILIFMQRSVYNVVFVSCGIIFEKLDLS